MRTPWIYGIAAALLAVVIGERRAHARSSGGRYGVSGGSDPVYTLSLWRPLVAARLAFHPALLARPGALAFAMAWLDSESGGNPCAYGDAPPAGTAPDGNPREMGLGQIYSPDDIARIAPKVAPMGIKLSSASLRAYCAPGTQHRTRELTPDEMIEQIEATLLVPIDEGVAWADAALAKNGLDWNAVDTWKLVKAHHAYPPILHALDVLHAQGKTPASWVEYRTMLNAYPAYAPDARNAAKVSDRNPQGYVNFAMHRGFEMCERLGNATVDEGAVS